MSILTRSERVVGAESKRNDQCEPSWQAELRGAVRDTRTLCEKLDLPVELATGGAGGAEDFPVFVPPAFLARIRRGDPNDPLLRQVLPLADESLSTDGFSLDPVGDGNSQIQPGVLQKYSGRALLITTGACAIHCRYCFRRHYPYEEAPHSDAAWEAALRSVAQDDTIEEVILSGGDPWMLVDAKLEQLVDKIARIEHVRRLRVHTRLPIMIPARVTQRLVDCLAGTRLRAVVVVHANHAQELDNEVAAAVRRLLATGTTMLNQAVLLRGVNDSVEEQARLSERLIEIGVLPYYLHQLDRVIGASHFEVPIAEGREIVNQLRARLPGYLVPRYVREVPGEESKTIVG